MQRNLERSSSAPETNVDAILNLAIESLTYSSTMRNCMAKDLGKQLGLDIAKSFPSMDSDSIIEHLSELWLRNGFGDIGWLDTDKMLLHSAPYADISNPHNFYNRHCAFKEGMLEAILQKIFQREIVVKEISHSTNANQSCIFKVSNAKIAQS